MPKPVILPPTDKTPEEIAQAILNYRPAQDNAEQAKDEGKSASEAVRLSD